MYEHALSLMKACLISPVSDQGAALTTIVYGDHTAKAI